MKEIKGQVLTGERALFKAENLRVENCTFEDGESPLKESKNIDISGSVFGWKYPVWYSENIRIKDCEWKETGRAGVWYTKNLHAENCLIDAPKNFRRCENIHLEGVRFTRAQETLWSCRGVTLDSVEVVGDYFGMNCENVTAENLRIDGNYCFDGAKNVTIRHSVLNSKDSFWNSENVTCEDCVIIGEYLAWNAKNLTLINCTIDSLQGLCYIENLTLINCDLKSTDLSFEFCSNVDATVTSHIVSVKNPISGKIRAKSIGELILDGSVIDPTKTEIITEKELYEI